MPLIIFLVLLFIEVVVSSEFAAAVGGVVFFLEIVVGFIAGAVILANFRYAIVEQINNFAFGKISQEELISKGVFSLVGAILIMIPGIVTDAVGIMMQFSWFAAFAARNLFRNSTYTGDFTQRRDNDYIDVEVVDEDDHRSDSALKR